jgi:hypothetical protein
MVDQPPSSQPTYQPPQYSGYAPPPPKSRGTALLLEILPGLFGFLGFGWIYGGNTTTGLLWLAGMIVWDMIAVLIDVLSAGLACFCTVPVNLALIAVSSMLLSTYTKQHPELFGI